MTWGNGELKASNQMTDKYRWDLDADFNVKCKSEMQI